MLRYAMPVLNAFATACCGCVLSVKKRVAAFPSLPAIECRFCGANRFSDSVLGGRTHSNLAFSTSIIHSFDINVEMPKIVPNQFIFERTPRIFDIRVVPLVYPWKVHEVGAAVSTVPCLNPLFTTLLGLAKTMKTIITVSAGARNLLQWFTLWAWHLCPYLSDRA
jgi:hypothetical protein